MSLLRDDPVVTRYGYTGSLIYFQELSTDHPLAAMFAYVSKLPKE